MATKSILKTIHIKKSLPAIKLLKALEHADGKVSQPVNMSKMYSDASPEEIRMMLSV